MNRPILAALACLTLWAPARASTILYVVDGMSWGQLQLAHDAAQRFGRPLAMETVLNQGHAAACEVNPLGALVPESGASASALATGHKVANRSLSQLPTGRKVETILERAARLGLATGLVTTARLTHATPAAFLCHLGLRDDEDEAARQIVDSKVDVLFGAGAERFPPSLLERAKTNGYEVTLRSPGLSTPPPSARRWLGLFAEQSFPFALDRGSEPAPTLAEMTRAAIKRLSRAQKGFVLVVDARLVDEASHDHDAAAVLSEMREADQAVAEGLGYLRLRRDVTIVVASNHDTGGMGMVWRVNPPPARFGGTRELDLISAQKASLRWMLQEIWRRSDRGKSLDARLVRQTLKAHLSPEIAVSEADAASVVDALRAGPKRLPFDWSPAIHAMSRVLEPYYLVSWSTGGHTSSPVPCFGLGPGTQALHGLVDDTAVFRALTNTPSR